MRRSILMAGFVTAMSVLTALLLVSKKPQPQPQDSFKQVIIHNERSQLPVWHPDYQTAQAVIYEAGEPDEKELEGVQCPIPMKDRVKNYTGIQCVFSSLECIGRWAELKALYDPPITSRSDCKSYSGPSDASNKLQRLGVKFEMSYRDRNKSLALLKKAMAEGRGALFGVPGHAMVVCHYDEEKGVVKYINNSNHRLPIETMSLNEFNRKWDTWVIVVYADPDPFPAKAGRLDLPNSIPIVDRNNPQGKYDKKYIPTPSRP